LRKRWYFPLLCFYCCGPFRKIGWIFSPFLYKVNIVLCIIILTTWGLSVGLIVGALDWKLQPNIVLKILFGFLEGLYLSSPNFGLLNESTIPLEAEKRHKIISHYPQVVFTVIVLFLFYTNYEMLKGLK
jgi:hypothetical protein